MCQALDREFKRLNWNASLVVFGAASKSPSGAGSESEHSFAL